MPEPSETDAAQEADKGKDSKEKSSEEVPATKTIPDGIVPLFFSGPGQEIFGCVADSDVTVENPHKLIAKEMILEDFKNRAAVSDFHPVKKTVMVRLQRPGWVLFNAHQQHSSLQSAIIKLDCVMICAIQASISVSSPFCVCRNTQGRSCC